MDKNNGEPALQKTLRDEFAMLAMQGWLASFGPDDAVKVDHVAQFAYEMADAMLAAREQ
jgi:hypothetical protein